MDSLPIGDYALISDCHSAALVSRDGSVDWLCCPRFDSPTVFGRLLDEGAGHFSIRPAGEHQATRRYADRTMVLETTFTTTGNGSSTEGTAVLTDALAVGAGERGHALGEESPGALLRRADVYGGRDRRAGQLRAATGVRPHPAHPASGRLLAWPPEADPTGCCCPPRFPLASTGPLPPPVSA